MPNKIAYMTEKHIHSITFGESDVTKIIKALDVNKAHGHDHISVRMKSFVLRLLLIHLLTLIFQNFLAAGIFPITWKKTNIVPIHEKNDNISKLSGCWYTPYHMEKNKYCSNF